MYQQFYQLKRAPFQAGADPRFFWKGEKYLKALDRLQHAIEHGSGVSLLTGDVGIGKTAVLHHLFGLLGKKVMTCLISDPGLTPSDFYQLVLHTYGTRRKISNRKDFHRYLTGLLQKAGPRGKKVLLVIDEAQRLSPQLTTEIVEMINLSSNTSGGLCVCLAAQTAADRRLIEPVIQAFGNDITADLHIDPLDPAETADYVRHRLKVAGAVGEIFSDGAMEAVFQNSGGYPIGINLICDFSLFSGFAERAPQITGDIVRWSADSLRLPDSTDELSPLEIPAEEIPETFTEPQMSDEWELEEEDAPRDAHDLIAPDAADKPEPSETPQTSAVPAAMALAPPGKKRRSVLKTALLSAAALVVVAGGVVFYTQKSGPLSGLLNHSSPRVSATANAPAAATVSPEPAAMPHSGDAPPIQALPPSPVETPASQKSAAGLPAADPGPTPKIDPPINNHSDIAGSQPSPALPPADEAEAVASRSAASVAAPAKPVGPELIQPLAQTATTEENREQPDLAETRSDRAIDEGQAAISEDPALPAVIKPDEARRATIDKATPPVVSATALKPGLQPTVSPAKNDSRPAPEQEVAPAAPQASFKKAVPAVEEPLPQWVPANKKLKEILKAGAFASPKKPLAEDTRAITAASPRSAPEPAPRKTAASPAAAPDEPDPSSVINWLLKKKGK